MSVLQFPGNRNESKNPVLGANRPRVIALSGWKGSGKDTVADYLVREYGYTRLSFAHALKNLVAQVYKIPREWMDDPEKKEQPLTQYPAIPTDGFSLRVHSIMGDALKSGYWTPRALCILEGSIKRSVYSNFWVKNIVDEMLANNDAKYVISDLRYKSESDVLRVLLPNVILARVNRYVSIDTNDPSERDLDDYHFDVYLGNTSSITDLQGHVDAMMFELSTRIEGNNK